MAILTVICSLFPSSSTIQSA